MTRKKWRKENIEILRTKIIEYLKLVEEEKDAKEVEECFQEEIQDLALLYANYFFEEQIKEYKEYKGET